MNQTGYWHPLYADSLSEFALVRHLPLSDGSILVRHIPGSEYRDAMGCYPLFVCRDWSGLGADLEGTGKDLVSLTAVTDPFGEYDEALLRRVFTDRIIPFKEHFVTDLSRPLQETVSKHHRYYSRKALKVLSLEVCSRPDLQLDEWLTLYTNLVSRHNLTGIKAFSRESFARQLSVPGIVMFRAVHQGCTIGAHLWYVHADKAYSHLAAFSEAGYDLMAAYALYWFALEYFASRKVRWLEIGAGAGISSADKDGLSRFKRGWSTGTRMAYLCGRIFDQAAYDRLAQERGILETDYVPAYRHGELS
jgi:hypothetical protein